MPNQIALSIVQTSNKDINQLQSNVKTALNNLQQQINSISGLTATITTAKLTSGGTEGSMTFTNGLLTAQIPST